MAKNKKNKQNRQNQIQVQNKVLVEKTPEMLALERKIAELADKKQNAQKRKTELEKKKRLAEIDLDKAEKERTRADNELKRLQQEAFEIRNAVRKVGELNLTEHSENADDKILSMLTDKTASQAKNSQNDDAILAVAVRYKLNNVLLYTEDKNLKNKAAAIGVKTI